MFLTNGMNSSVRLAGGWLNANSTTIGPGATLSGSGTVAGTVVNGGNIMGNGPDLSFTLVLCYRTTAFLHKPALLCILLVRR